MLIFQDRDRIVFAGDSVTDMGSVHPVGEGRNEELGTGYVRMVENLLAACYPRLRIRVTNSGVSGNTSRELLERYQRDVVDLHPDWVSVCVGINDVWRQVDSPSIPDRQVMPEEYRQNMEQMILAVKGVTKGMFILSPYYMEPNRQESMRARMDEYGQICRELAEEHGCIYVDFQKMYDDFCKVRHSSSIAWDRIHPNQIGSMMMARAFLEKCGFEWQQSKSR